MRTCHDKIHFAYQHNLAPKAMALAARIVSLAEKTFCGSGDLEAQDALTFHDYFMATYPPGSPQRDQLVVDMQGLEQRVKTLTGWVPEPIVTTVLPFPPNGQIDRFVVAPWQLGLAAEDSVKGPSKMVYILDTVSNFLARPYFSQKEPLDILFAKAARPGDAVDDWSLVHSIGMGKSWISQGMRKQWPSTMHG